MVKHTKLNQSDHYTNHPPGSTSLLTLNFNEYGLKCAVTINPTDRRLEMQTNYYLIFHSKN